MQSFYSNRFVIQGRLGNVSPATNREEVEIAVASMNMVILSFVAFLLAFTAIGVLSSLKKKKTTDDYLIAGRSIGPWLTALSAVATNNSGFMFIGLIGYAYRYGVSASWMMIGWIIGDLVAWLLVHRRVRAQSEEVDVATVPALIGTQHDQTSRPVVMLSGLLTFVLLSVYAAAQLKAGSTALQSLFGWDPRTGALIGASIVVVYCFSGGIRASIWTDAAQSVVMLLAMAVLLTAAAMKAGGPASVWTALVAQDPELVRWLPRDLAFGFGPYLLGMIFGGFGAIGQPHILVRFMAIESAEKMRQARTIYFLWFVPFFVAGIAVGLYARVLIPDLSAMPLAQGMSAGQATELAMPQLAQLLLPDVLIGLTLAGLFSATMSTADSQILVCSGTLTQDVNPRWRGSYFVSKIGTLLVTGLSLGIALFAGQNVFSLVLIAWSALGAGLGPVLLLRVFHVRISTTTSLLMMTTGVLAVVGWNLSGYDGDVFKLLPGMLASFSVFLLARATFDRPSVALAE